MQLSSQSGLDRNVSNDISILTRLTELFESGDKYLNAIKLCCLTNKDLIDTIVLIIEDDGRDKFLKT